MLGYYETVYEAVGRLGKDRSWISQLCQAQRIAPHVVHFEGKWFIPKDAWVLPPGETAPVFDRVEGYESMTETAERLGKNVSWITQMLKEGRLEDAEGRSG